MSKIQLTNKYYFSADENQYILYECGTRNKIDIKTKKPTGEIAEYENTIGYYSSLTSLIKGCVQVAARDKVKNGEIDSLKECLNYIKDLEEKILDITNGF